MAISPIDGRYAAQLREIETEFSEEALFRNRVRVEAAWLRALAAATAVGELAALPGGVDAELSRLETAFGPADAAAIKDLERVINHDVKAVEYYLKQRLTDAGLSAQEGEFIHFACTSEDINNLAHGLMLIGGLANAWVPAAHHLVDGVAQLAEDTRAVPMPSHTHGQTATPTTLGKELAVFVARWRRQLKVLQSWRPQGKLNGATGTFSAHLAAYPDLDWIALSQSFVEGLGLEWNPLTTQIESHDSMAELFHLIVRFNAITLDFCRDVWEYISRGYLKQATKPGEVGSSTMPHKVNPIDFENAEANLGVANALFEHLATKLAVSRMQRDLSDSSAIRSIGTAFAHATLALKAATRGLGKLSPAPTVMAQELDQQWEVLAEAVQTVMRRYGLPEPYEQLKALTRGERVTQGRIEEFVRGLDLPAEAKAGLLQLTPGTYVGLAADLVDYQAAAG